MRRLNVRCCCQPLKILGTLDWDEDGPRKREWIVDKSIFALEVHTMTHYVHVSPQLMSEIFKNPQALDIVREMRREELAFKAEGAPIELLRRLPGFIEGDSV